MPRSVRLLWFYACGDASPVNSVALSQTRTYSLVEAFMQSKTENRLLEFFPEKLIIKSSKWYHLKLDSMAGV